MCRLKIHLLINVLVHNEMIFCHFDDVSILILVLSKLLCGNAEGKVCFFLLLLFFILTVLNLEPKLLSSILL